MIKIKTWIVFFILLGIFAWILITFALRLNISMKVKQYVFGNYTVSWKANNDMFLRPRNVPPKRILLYTLWFGSLTWWGPRNQDGYHLQQCSINNCMVTNDRSHFQNSDAVLFHGRDIPSAEKLRKLRNHKPDHQIWVWNIFESPYNIRVDLKQYNKLFEWTASYRVDSEVFLPYFRTSRLEPGDPRPKIGKNFAAGKSQMIIAFISNCLTERMSIIKTLKKYISFDLLGDCQKEVHQNISETWCRKYSERCARYFTKHKFYFAMENAYCIDYITEKFYTNGLEYFAVPIVFGGAGGPDFANPILAPPKSYINALDFKDLKSLANYLTYLDSNDTAYNEYHTWRYKYKIEFGWSMCEVCKQLWHPPKLSKTGFKLAGFFNKEKRCVLWKKVLSKFLK